MAPDGRVVRLELPSSFELLDVVQVLSDQVSMRAGLDEDGVHWVSVAVRESVINAIKHGNGGDRSKRVVVEFEVWSGARPDELVVRCVMGSLRACRVPPSLGRAEGRFW